MYFLHVCMEKQKIPAPPFNYVIVPVCVFVFFFLRNLAVYKEDFPKGNIII